MLFCTLTNEQRNLYRSYLASAEVADILAVRVAIAYIKLPVTTQAPSRVLVCGQS